MLRDLDPDWGLKLKALSLMRRLDAMRAMLFFLTQPPFQVVFAFSLALIFLRRDSRS